MYNMKITLGLVANKERLHFIPFPSSLKFFSIYTKYIFLTKDILYDK